MIRYIGFVIRYISFNDELLDRINDMSVRLSYNEDGVNPGDSVSQVASASSASARSSLTTVKVRRAEIAAKKAAVAAEVALSEETRRLELEEVNLSR